jgi:hypothetical protein
MATAAPQTAMDMPQGAAPNPFSDPKTTQVYDQMRQSVSPKQFGDEILAGASQVDPEEVTKFRSALEKLEVPMEVLDMLNNMVDEILANPDNYAQVKQKYEAMGVTEDLLPAEFDGYFFSALNMAVDQMIAEPAGAQAFAKGGIAELSPISKAVANYGRNGDTMLAHITPAEARMLRRRGGAGTTNPNTGLKEYFSLGGLFKSIGNAVKDFASSTVGKIVTTVALGFFLGPAAASFMGVTGAAGVAAVSGFVGGAGSTLLGGGNLTDALKAGAIGGLTAGVMGGVTQGFDTAYTGPTTVGGQVDKFTNMFSPSAAAPAPAVTASGVQAPAIDASGQVAGLAPTEPVNYGTQNLPQAQSFPVGDSMSPAVDNLPPVQAAPATEIIPKRVSLPEGGGPVAVSQTELPGAGTLTHNTMPVGPPVDATQFEGSLAKPGGRYSVPGVLDSATQMGKGMVQMLPGTDGTLSQGFENFKQGASDLFSPGPTSEQVTSRAGEILKADATGKMTFADALQAAKAEGPGLLRTYGPAAAVGIGTLAATGGFKPTAAAESTLKPELMKPVTQRIAEQGNQRNYYLQNLPGVKYDQYGAPIFGQSNPFPMYDTGLGIASLNPRGYAAGGAVHAGNLDTAAYIRAYPEAGAAVARGDYPTAYDYYMQVGKAAGHTVTAVDQAAIDAAQAATQAEKEAAQAANRKLVADAEAARKAAGYGSAYQNINAGLSYDAPAGYAAPAIAAREAAFKPTMDKFTNAQAANAATLAKPYTPTVVPTPYNNADGYKNVITPVAPPINYDTTPEFTAAQRVAIQNMPKDVSKLTAMDKAGIYTNLADNRLSDQQIRNAAEAAYGAQTTPDWKVLQDVVDQKRKGESIGLRLPSDWTSKNAAQKIDYFNTQGTDAAALARAGIGQADIDYMTKNGLRAAQTAPPMGVQGPPPSMDFIPDAPLPEGMVGTLGGSGYDPVTGRMDLGSAGGSGQYVERKLLNMGGIASLGSGGYPRRTGKISGPGTATSDSIPAMLSDGEFVMTAKAVRGAGKGDKRAGAKRMYALMNQLEKNAARG